MKSALVQVVLGTVITVAGAAGGMYGIIQNSRSELPQDFSSALLHGFCQSSQSQEAWQELAASLHKKWKLLYILLHGKHGGLQNAQAICISKACEEIKESSLLLNAVILSS